MYFTEQRLATKIYEKRHTDRLENEENKRKKLIKNELGCKFVRINPDAEDYDNCVEIGKIQNHIIESTEILAKESTEESTKKSLIKNISGRLLKLKFEESHSINQRH